MIQSSLTGVLIALALTATAVAAPISPTFDTFGPLPAATFGGSGIPNDAVAISTIVDGDNTITLGLSATPRFTGTVGNDGAGTFSAEVGGYVGPPPPADPALSRWNFSFYASLDDGGITGDTFSSYMISLLYDLDPAAGTDDSDHGVIDLSAAFPSDTLVEGSQNPGFSFLTVPIPSVLIPPTFAGGFDPSAIGEYTFALRVSDLSGGSLGEASIAVNTVPEPTSMALFGLTALGMGGAIRRRKKQGEAVNEGGTA